MMRFRGGGVGHKSTREATDFFKNDRDRLDKQTATATQVAEVDDEEGYASGAENIEDEEEDYGYERADMDSEIDQSGDEIDDFGYADL
jgi:hypothetical protein